VSAVSVNFTGKDPHEPSSEHPPGAFVTTSAAQVQSTIDEERIQLIMERVFAEKATPFLERLQKDIGDIKVHEVIEKMDRYIDKANRELLRLRTPETKQQSELRRGLEQGEYEAVYNETERISNRDDKAERYRSIAGLCVDIDSRHHALKAAHKYLELSGESVTAYRFIGYTYWWFKDTDTAIPDARRAHGTHT
jgi:hypothetical protein